MIKLVIWDLDDTIWEGGLVEIGYDNIKPFDNVIDYFRKNVEKGVMNSICSLSSNQDVVIKKLKELGILDYVVFPSINTFPKGQRVKDIITNMQLRSVNVLFVDDLEVNLEDVKYHCEGINVVNSKSKDMFRLFENILEESKDDKELLRLSHYKILEEKHELRQTYDSDTRFLFDSDIRISLKHKPMEYLKRIEELINRTNQLNFTKKEAIKANLIKENSYVVNVCDKYGDYGICGFVSYDKNGMEHFVFSCMVLNMGIETFCFHHLGCPKFEIVGEVSAAIGKEKPNWITIEPFKDIEKTVNKKDTFLIGGCDLQQIYPFMENKERIYTFFPYTGSNKKHAIRRDCLDILLSSKLSKEQIDHVLKTVPYFDAKTFVLPSYKDFDTIIYSPLEDYLDHTYTSKGIELTLNWEISSVITESDMKKYHSIKGISVDKQKIFFHNWKRIEKNYGKKLAEFLNLIKAVKMVIIILGATNTYSDLNKDWCEEYKKLNNISRTVAKDHHVVCIDVDKYIQSRSDFINSIRHYKKHIYLKMAEEINTLKLN